MPARPWNDIQMKMMLFILSTVLMNGVHASECDDAFRKILLTVGQEKTIHPGITEAQKQAKKILDMKGKSLVERTITSGMDRQDLIYVYGVPERIREIEHHGTTVFRHYTDQAIDAIVESGELKSGPRPFIDPEAHARWEYQDLNGVMFTDPKVKASELWMNLNDHADWIEFTLDEKIPVILCKEKNFLVPLQRHYPDWIRSTYARFLETGKADPSLMNEFEKIRNSGGMLPRQGIPIRILRYSKNGVIHHHGLD